MNDQQAAELLSRALDGNVDILERRKLDDYLQSSPSGRAYAAVSQSIQEAASWASKSEAQAAENTQSMSQLSRERIRRKMLQALEAEAAAETSINSAAEQFDAFVSRQVAESPATYRTHRPTNVAPEASFGETQGTSCEGWPLEFSNVFRLGAHRRAPRHSLNVPRRWQRSVKRRSSSTRAGSSARASRLARFRLPVGFRTIRARKTTARKPRAMARGTRLPRR